MIKDFKIIHTLTWRIHVGDYRKFCESDLLCSFLTSSEGFWLIMAGDFSGSILTGFVWYTHQTQPQTLRRDSLELSIDLKVLIIDLNETGKSLGAISKPWDQLYKLLQLYSTWPSCVTAAIRKKTITCCWEKIGQDGQESTKKHPKASL